MVYSVITQESKGAVYLIGIIHLDGELLLNSNDLSFTYSKKGGQKDKIMKTSMRYHPQSKL